MNFLDRTKILDCIKSNNIESAEHLRISCMPNAICKFIPLDINGDYASTENQKRFSALLGQSIWVSNVTRLNDPSEFQGLYLNLRRLEETRWSSAGISRLRRMANSAITSFGLTSFSDIEALRSLPMWSHYANVHKGFCIVYKINDTRHLYPVLYTPSPVDGTEIFCGAHNAQIDHVIGTRSPSIEEPESYYPRILQMLIKQCDWSYEQEVRLLHFETLEEKTPGRLIKAKSAGLEAACVIAGSNCSERHRETLREISQELDLIFKEATLGSSSFIEFN